MNYYILVSLLILSSCKYHATSSTSRAEDKRLERARTVGVRQPTAEERVAWAQRDPVPPKSPKPCSSAEIEDDSDRQEEEYLESKQLQWIGNQFLGGDW